MSDTDDAIEEAQARLKMLDRTNHYDVKAMVWALIAIARAVQSIARTTEGH